MANIRGACNNCNEFYEYATENDCQIHKSLSLLCMLGNFDIFINHCPFSGYEDLSKGYISTRYCAFFNETMLLCHKIKAVNRIIQKHSKAIRYHIMGCENMDYGRCIIDSKIGETK